ncbi:MAG: hypothetical protein EON54_05425 [Alcaligenaceae bacterium]|nr:MAG: hypothetical protein EON54_05425 [Alcaligenaceae bacterium]
MRRQHFIARIAPAEDLEFTFLSEWHLLVYESAPSDDQISRDIRDVIQVHPFSRRISVAMPSVNAEICHQIVNEGTAKERVRGIGSLESPELSTLCFNLDEQCIAYRKVGEETPEYLPIPDDVRDAWFFDLFHRHNCLVAAPDGIHFGKTSGKHSAHFIRASNSLMSTLECDLIAFFLMPFAYRAKPQRIYVDTAPLISVGMALIRLFQSHNIWRTSPPIESFSSYDGIDALKHADGDHLVLISASTSGGLELEVLSRTERAECIATIFYIQGKNQAASAGFRLCDLTETPNRLFGYPEITTFTRESECEWCQAGIPFAEFEGDQFLLQKRKTQYINIRYHPTAPSKCSMKKDARDFFSSCNGRDIFSVRIAADAIQGYRDVQIDQNQAFIIMPSVLEAISDAIRRNLKISRADYFVYDDLELTLLEIEKSLAQKTKAFVKARDIQTKPPVENGSAIVLTAVLKSPHGIRKINEILRSIVPDGEVHYVSYATIVESCIEFHQLCAALRTGAKGPNTYEYSPGNVLLFRNRVDLLSSWDKEKELLQRIIDEDAISNIDTDQEIIRRRRLLIDSGILKNDLFWRAQNGSELRLQRDFVFLQVSGEESQAYVYAVVSNLLSTALEGDRDPTDRATLATDVVRQSLRETVYSRALLEVNNFAKFNDAILRGCLLRAAEAKELNYSTDHASSETMKNIILHEIGEWQFSRGQILPEFLCALASRHMRLADRHAHDVCRSVCDSRFVPDYVKRLANAIKFD